MTRPRLSPKLRSMGKDSRAERGMTAFLVFVVSLPGLAAGLCLGLSFAYSPVAIAGGEHLGPLQGSFAQCAGCALCGMSRAFSAFSHGDFAAAMDFNGGVALGYPLAWLCVLTSIYSVRRTLRDRPRFFAAPRVAPTPFPTAQEGELHV